MAKQTSQVTTVGVAIGALAVATGLALACSPVAPMAAAVAPPQPASAPAETPPVAATGEAAKSTSPAAELDGYRWEFPCKEPLSAKILKPEDNVDCSSLHVTGDPMKTDNFKITKKFGGEPGKMYAVTLRFRGVVEPMTYKDGTKDGDTFYVGGVPVDEHYNIYELEVSSPKSHYYLNRQDEVGHKIFTLDYTETIKVEGGASITLSGDGQNGLMISNFKRLTVPELAPEPYNGQFIQMNVVSVTEAK